MPAYLALGDSMSIDDYTGVEGGGAVRRFYRWLGRDWTLDDRTFDGCRMQDVPLDGKGDVITLTVGGNDLLWNREQYLSQGLAGFAAEHLKLLRVIRAANPWADFIVGDIYAPQFDLSEAERVGLDQANMIIRENCATVGAQLAGVHGAFRRHEAEYLCLGIEPTLQGAEVIARLFRRAFRQAEADRLARAEM
jgi:lysophospholipase L1-like esterase